MKKRILAVFLAAALCVSMGASALAAGTYPSGDTSSSSSSGSSSSSSSSGSTSSSSGSSDSSSSGSSGGSSSSSAAEDTNPATMGTANTDETSVAVAGADGTVSTVNLTEYTKRVGNLVEIVAADPAQAGKVTPGEAVSAVMTTPASALFKATIDVLGGKIKAVNVGGYKPVLTVTAPTGQQMSSIGPVHGVTKYAFIVLTAVDEDGTIEIVEGIVEPVTGHVVGLFKGTPVVVTVNVIVPAV